MSLCIRRHTALSNKGMWFSDLAQEQSGRLILNGWAVLSHGVSVLQEGATSNPLGSPDPLPRCWPGCKVVSDFSTHSLGIHLCQDSDPLRFVHMHAGPSAQRVQFAVRNRIWAAPGVFGIGYTARDCGGSTDSAMLGRRPLQGLEAWLWPISEYNPVLVL